MKKNILGLALLSIVSASFAANAQTPACNGTPTCNGTPVCNGPQVCNVTPVCNGTPDSCALKTECRMKCDFQGIELTDVQKTRIRDLNNGLNVSRKEMRDQDKQRKETTRVQKDSLRTLRAQQMKELRTKYINDLGKILSPDQMLTYLKNYYVNNPCGKGSAALKRGGVPMQKVAKLDRKKGDGKKFDRSGEMVLHKKKDMKVKDGRKKKK